MNNKNNQSVEAKVVIFVLRDLSVGGIPRVVVDLCKNWNLVNKNDSVYLITLSNKSTFYNTPKNTTHIDLRKVTEGAPGLLIRIGNKFLPNIFTQLTLEYKTKILHSHIINLKNKHKAPTYTILCGYGAISEFIPAKLPNCLCVAHNLYSKMLRERTKYLYPINKFLFKRQIKNANFAFVSKTIKEDLSSGFKTPRQSPVLYNPLDLERVKQFAASNNQYSISGRYLLYLGRLEPEKHVDRICNAFLAAKKPNDVELKIAGTGSLNKKLEGIAKKSNDKIQLLGNISNPYPLISSSAGLILASDFEGLPTVALEARALGKLVLSSSAGGSATEALDSYTRHIPIKDNNVIHIKNSIESIDWENNYSQLEGMEIFSSSSSIKRYNDAMSRI